MKMGMNFHSSENTVFDLICYDHTVGCRQRSKSIVAAAGTLKCGVAVQQGGENRDTLK